MTPVAASVHVLSAAWFSACGLALEASDVREVAGYLAELGADAATRVEPVASWDQAELIIRSPMWEPAWWEREEAERKRLLEQCIDRLGRAAALETLGLEASVGHDLIHGAAAVAAARSGVSDPALIRAAAGSASMAAHGHALARLAGAGVDHFFMRRYRLFEGGRWPLGVVDGAFHLF